MAWCGAAPKLNRDAELKLVDLNCDTVDSAMAMVAGAARSMGIEVVD
jgi:ribosomal protein L11